MRPLISIVPLGMLGALHVNARHRCAAQYNLRRWAAQEQRVVRRFEDADPVVQRLIDPSYRGVSGASCSRSTVRCL